MQERLSDFGSPLCPYRYNSFVPLKEQRFLIRALGAEVQTSEGEDDGSPGFDSDTLNGQPDVRPGRAQ